jgi:hypothetical protein
MTPAELQAAFPEFVDVDVKIIQRHITAADPYLDVTVWGDRYTDGLGHFVGHRMEMERRRIAGGAASAGDAIEKRVGAVTVRRSEEMAKAQAENPYLETLHGREFWRLAGEVGMGAIAV